MRFWIVLCLLVVVGSGGAVWAEADFVLVDKSARRLHVMDGEEVIASFKATFGTNPQGHKEREGDGRTPEGRYVLDYKNANSGYFRSIHVSYPNDADRQRAEELGVDPGGDIMIHGQKAGYGWLAPLSRFVNWTDGCIALSDTDMERVWGLVPAGTLIEIRP